MMTPDEKEILASLLTKATANNTADQRLENYFEGAQRLVRLGLAVPPNLNWLETMLNWPRLVANTLTERIGVRSFTLPGQAAPDNSLLEGWTANDLDTEQRGLWTEKHVFGRAFVSVGTNEENKDFPIISVERTREITVEIDPRRRIVKAALRLTNDFATLYLPNSTIWLEKNGQEWIEADRDDHNLGKVPVVPIFNQRRPGLFSGTSEIIDAISMTDAAARALTNLQLAGETAAIPQRYFLGMEEDDFRDDDDNPVPAWEAYFTSIWSSSNKDAQVGAFPTANLDNFTKTVDFYGRQLSGMYGLPSRYFGSVAANPSSADGIRAEEHRLILRAEASANESGDALGRVMSLYHRFKTGEWLDGSRISTQFHDPATPSLAARTDSALKLKSTGLISREGAWDMLGWSESRKIQEAERLQREAEDPLLMELVNQAAGEPSQ